MLRISIHGNREEGKTSLACNLYKYLKSKGIYVEYEGSSEGNSRVIRRSFLNKRTIDISQITDVIIEDRE